MRIFRVYFDLISEVLYVSSDEFRAASVTWIIPDILKKLLTGKYLPRIGHKVVKKIKLNVRQQGCTG
jgi:hypothetical protein